MISTNYEKFYIKGEKSGANTITLSSHYLINVEIEENTSNLNGNVSYDVVGNGTKNVDITFTYSDLYINGETYNATVTASDGIDTLIIPVIINCSDTLIYETHEIMGEGGDRILNIHYSSLPEVNSVILNNTIHNLDVTNRLYEGNIIIESYELDEFEYVIAKNNLSQISILLNNVVDSDNTGGDNTGGDNTGGDNTGGDNTGGDNTGGDNTGGDNTGDDNTGDDNTGDDNTGDVPEGYQLLFTADYNLLEKDARVMFLTNYPYSPDLIISHNGRILKHAYNTKTIYHNSAWIVINEEYHEHEEEPLKVYTKSLDHTFSYLFLGCFMLHSVKYINPNIQYGNMQSSNFFLDCNNLISIPPMYMGTNMDGTFEGCTALTSIPQLDTSNVTDMSEAFSGCTALTSIPQLDTSNVTDMYQTFYGCTALTSIPQLDTSKVTYMGSTFEGCTALTSIPQLDTSKVTYMGSTFEGCTALTSIPQLDTSKVTYMGSTFYGCSALTSIPQLDTSNVTSMTYAFYGCSALTNLGGFVGMGEGSPDANIYFDLSHSPLLTHESLMNVINNLAVMEKRHSMTLGEVNLAKLTDDEIKIATDKNWTVS